MSSKVPFQANQRRLGQAVLHWLSGWWRIVHFGALMLVLALSPSSYSPATRQTLARQLVLSSAPNLAWFTMLSAILSLVLIRIVIVTAHSYGLTQYALQMVVRVLVLELIPLSTALFVALRCTLPDAARVADMRMQGQFDAMQQRGADPLCEILLPKVLAGMVTVVNLALASAVVALVLAYVMIYGFSPAALAFYTRVVGQVFSPAVTIIFVLKTFFFSMAVALIPIASAYSDGRGNMNAPGGKGVSELKSMVRLSAVVLLIELVSLIGNYS